MQYLAVLLISKLYFNFHLFCIITVIFESRMKKKTFWNLVPLLLSKFQISNKGNFHQSKMLRNTVIFFRCEHPLSGRLFNKGNSQFFMNYNVFGLTIPLFPHVTKFNGWSLRYFVSRESKHNFYIWICKPLIKILAQRRFAMKHALGIYINQHDRKY